MTSFQPSYFGNDPDLQNTVVVRGAGVRDSMWAFREKTWMCIPQAKQIKVLLQHIGRLIYKRLARTWKNRGKGKRSKRRGRDGGGCEV